MTLKLLVNLSMKVLIKDIPDFGTSVVSGAYPKAVGTQRGGYIVKQFYASYQGVVLGDKGSDCGSGTSMLLLIRELLRYICIVIFKMVRN